MWKHNLNTACPVNQSISNYMPKFLSKAHLSNHPYSMIMAFIHTNLTSKYYSVNQAFCNGSKKFLVAFLKEGILCTSIKGNNSTYVFTGKSGFISASDISSIRTTPYQIRVLAKNNRVFSFIHQIRLSSPLASRLATYYSNSHKKIITEGNLFDLDDDPSFAGTQKHIMALKRTFNDNSSANHNQLVDIQAKYTPAFNSNIFKDCINQAKYFIASLSSNYILLFKLKNLYNHKLFFFTGENYCIPTSYLTNEVFYRQPINQYCLIATMPTLILKIINPEIVNKAYFPYLPETNALYNYIHSLNPHFILKIKSKIYIKRQYQHITQKYLAKVHHSAKGLSFTPSKHHIAIKTAMSFLAVALWGSLFMIGLVGTWPLWLILTGVLIFSLSACSIMAWITYYQSLSFSSKFAWTSTFTTALAIAATTYIALF